MHHIYHTEALILGSKNYGETGRYYFLLTKDLGMIYASAQGVRKMSSKLRYVLQDFSYIKVDLVQGKDFWRITSATKTNELGQVTKNPQTFRVFHNIARLLRRLLAGVEPNESLFADLVRGLSVLEQATESEDLRNIESIIVLRIVNNLGYIGESDVLENFIKSPFEENLVFEASKNRRAIVKEINRALKETHL